MEEITVIIPTYRRPIDLVRCLNALKKQKRLPDEVLVIVRDSDAETWQLFRTFDTQPLPLHQVTVTTSGVVSAMNLGLAKARGNIIALPMTMLRSST
jgi:glycosyltransferase involved in cell wall biosynthesis